MQTVDVACSLCKGVCPGCVPMANEGSPHNSVSVCQCVSVSVCQCVSVSASARGDSADSAPCTCHQGRAKLRPCRTRCGLVSVHSLRHPTDPTSHQASGHMESARQDPAPGSLTWRLSSHPITLLTFLFFRVCECPTDGGRPSAGACGANLVYAASLLIYLFGLRLFTSNLYESSSSIPCPAAPQRPTVPSDAMPCLTSTCASWPLQRTDLHSHDPSPRDRFLLSEKHCRSAARRTAVVERGGHNDGRLAMGFRVGGRPAVARGQRQRQDSECDGPPFFLDRAVCATRAMDFACRRGTCQPRVHLADARRCEAPFFLSVRFLSIRGGTPARETDEKLTLNSHRPRTHHHKHARLQPV